MTDFKSMVAEVLKKNPNPELDPQTPQPKFVADTAKPGKVRTERSVNNPYTAAEAQRVYNPSLPPVPGKPLKDQLDMGTAGAMDMTGRWGGPNAK